ncbi:MAG: hypothetical protein LQ342_003712 [Letrouitia transgressa]|nr:MAG: hypothetical protein LQ342_003712 [Letrouitia transgressa]
MRVREMESRPSNGDKPLDDKFIAALETIHCKSLRFGANNEPAKLLRACRDEGFFYLDMRDLQDGFVQAIEDIYALERDLFELPEEILRQYDIDKLSKGKLNGYKPLGRNRGGLSDGKDGFESYAVFFPVPQTPILFADFHQLPKDGILSLATSDFQRPEIITKYLPSLRIFATAVAEAAQTIFSALTELLNLPQDSPALQSLHRSSYVCNSDIIRLLKYRQLSPSEQGAPHIAHTDIGSLTFLFTKQPGLQVQRSASKPSEAAEAWEWVAPAPLGSAIVNLGDGLSMLSGGYLKSCLHRVIPFPGEAEARYSFAYMLRAENDVLMRDLRSPPAVGSKAESELLTSAEWFEMKYRLLRGATWNRDQNWMLAGGKEAVTA